MRRFDYNWKNLSGLLFLLVPIGVVAAATKGKVPWWIWLAGFLWTLLWKLLPLARVYISDDLVLVEYLLPLRKSRKFTHDTLLGYQPVAITIRGQSVPFMGYLHPKSGKPVALWNAGTSGFPELSEMLCKRLPFHEP